MAENDVWIAALCLQHDRTLVTRDGDFEHVDARAVVGWSFWADLSEGRTTRANES
jgi:predicted nucleic acid-binding protein